VFSWLFLVSIPVQVFFAGAAVMVNPSWWTFHLDFVHVLEWFPLLMLAFAFAARLPASLKWMSVAAGILVAAQYALIATRPSFAAAFHVVNALVIFGLALEIARRAPSWRA